MSKTQNSKRTHRPAPVFGSFVLGILDLFGIWCFGFGISPWFRSLTLVLAICLAGAVRAPAAEPWRFIITCDSRGGLATGVNDAILGEMVRETLHWNADFLVFAGDLVYGAGVSPAQFETQLWNWVKVVRPLYDAGVGVYVCRGNHEAGDMWRAEPNEPPNPKENYALRWLNVFGSDQHPELKLPDNGPADEKHMTYAVAHKNVLVLALDQYAGAGHRVVHSVNQSWVDAQLRTNTKPHVFAFGHEPAFRTFHSDCLDAYPDRRDAFWRSLASAGARVYTCGHDHYYDHARIDDGDGNPNNDVHQLIVATAGAPSYSWMPPYRGDNGPFYPVQLYHVEQRWGYVVVQIDDRNVTTTWMERHNNTATQPGIYKAKHVWTYTAAGCRVKLAADLNGDCRVDFADLALLASEWLATGNLPSPPANPSK